MRTENTHEDLCEAAHKGGHSQSGMTLAGFGTTGKNVAKFDKGIDNSNKGNEQGQSIANPMNDKPRSTKAMTKEETRQDSRGDEDAPGRNHEAAVQIDRIHSGGSKALFKIDIRGHKLSSFTFQTRKVVGAHFRDIEQGR